MGRYNADKLCQQAHCCSGCDDGWVSAHGHERLQIEPATLASLGLALKAVLSREV